MIGGLENTIYQKIEVNVWFNIKKGKLEKGMKHSLGM